MDITRSLGIEEFQIKTEFKFAYTNPGTGNVEFNIRPDTERIGLNVKINYTNKTVELNTYKGGAWGASESVSDFKFDTALNTIRIVTGENFYNFYQNDSVVPYKYYSRMMPLTVNKITGMLSVGASIEGKLNVISVVYPQVG